MQAFQLFINSINTSVWLSTLALVYLCLTLWAIVHVLLNKELSGSAISWLGIILLSPGLGFLLYWLLGINRIKRRARREFNTAGDSVPACRSPAVDFPHIDEHLLGMMKTGLSIHQGNYIEHNTISPLLNGDQAYPEMLQAIREAQSSVVLSSYIFDYDNIGKLFIRELGAAHERGVAVRVLIDGIGIGYSFSWTKTDFALRRLGIPTARFLPTLSRRGTRFINLRNHRKILSIDGKVAFLGGINIRDNNVLADPGKLLPGMRQSSVASQTSDLHFRISGPVIDQVNALFAEDWHFACGEQLLLPGWQAGKPGNIICRILPDGPDDNYHKLHLTLTCAINAAVNNIRIVTPYFLPDGILTRALELASMRGVEVQVIVPSRSNIRLVDWALRASLRSLLNAGVKVMFGPRPFDHSKLLLVDDSWCMIGSSNWDARSLELNFEVNLECFDAELNAQLTRIFARKAHSASLASITGLSRDSLATRLRNNFFKLFSPYL